MSTYSTDSTYSTNSTDPVPSSSYQPESSDNEKSTQTKENIPQLLTSESESESEGNVLADGRNLKQNADKNPGNVPQLLKPSLTLSNAEVVMHRKEVELRTQLAGTYVLTNYVL